MTEESSAERGPDVPARVRELAKERGVTQRTIADALGLSQSAASRRLVGDVPFDVDELAAVAKVLGVPLTRLVEEAEAVR